MKLVKKMSDANPKIKFSDEFPAPYSGVAEVLQHCLMFNPYFRYTPDMLLSLKAFKNLRRTEERGEYRKINHFIDHPTEYDYESCESNSISLSDLCQIFTDEVLKSQGSK